MNRKLRSSIVVVVYFLICNLNAHTKKDSINSNPINTVASYTISSSTLSSLDKLDEEFPIKIAEQSKITSPEFTYDRIRSEYPIGNRILEDRQRAASLFGEIETQGRWVDTFANEDIQTMPLGIQYSDENGGVDFEIGLMSAVVTTHYIEFTAFARLTLQQTDDKGNRIQLLFGANNLKISHEGGIVGDANLVLMGDVNIPFDNGAWMLSFKGGFDYRTGITENVTYANIDCDGIKEIGIQGEVQFSRDKILPAKPNGELEQSSRIYRGPDGNNITIPNRVTGRFGIVVSDWNDIFAEISLSPFVMAKSPDKFLFSVNKAVLDFSDVRTENVTFPQFYYDNGLLFPSEENWRGVYVESLQVGLPDVFKTKKTITNGGKVSFDAHHMIIDNNGVTGFFGVNNLIPLNEGRTNERKGWAMSVDRIGVELAASRLVGAELMGRVMLPISEGIKDKINTTNQTGNNQVKGLAYQGLISEDEYALRLSSLGTVNFNLWKAKAQLHPNSYIELKVKDKSFQPKAVLNGNLTIATNLGDSNTLSSSDPNEKKLINFKGIEFQDLVLQTKSPIFQVGYFGYRGDLSIMNFPVSIGDIALTANDTYTSLGFDIKLNLMDKADKGFAAETRLEFFGRIQEENYKQRWKFDRVALRRIAINANMGAFKMSGGLTIMQNDPEYGDGFQADIMLGIKALGKIEVKANAIFGKKDFRYWYVDGLADNLPTGKAAPIGIKGFGGGAFYRMKRRGFSSAFSPSGLSYVPEAKAGLGLKAMVLFSIMNDKAVNGGAGFELLFNRNGGVNRMGLYGEAHIMKDINIPNPAAAITGKMKEMASKAGIDKTVDKLEKDKLTKPFVDVAKESYPAKIVGESGLNAYVGIEYDFQNKVLHGEADLYVDVALGVIKGRASGGRAGWAVLHLSKDEWYFHMGTPQDKLGLKIGFGPLRIETGGYFMIGDTMPASPPPPPEVADILGVEAESLNYMRDENAASNGRGFAFGADFKVDTGDLQFLMFYARFLAGGGFDIMLRDYGEAKCANTGDQVGINGWYANGQAYAYLQGALGIRIKLFFVKKRIPIIQGGAAVLFQAKAPNPIWLRGYVGGSFNLLGGLVKGKFRFKITLGKECVLVDTAPLGGIKMITDLTPTDNSGDVDVFAAPQATFALPVEKPIVIPEDTGDNTYKVILEKFRVIDEAGKEISGKLEWSYMKDRATFFSEDILPPETKLKVEVEVSFQQKINGAFVTINEDGKKAVETEIRNFTTGDAPNHIPLHNIQYAYPVVEQQQLYRNEYGNGYVQLKRGQDYLFEDPNWKSEIKFIEDTGKTTDVTFGYDYGKNQVQYHLPSLKKEHNYTYSIISLPKQSAGRTSNSRTTRTTKADKDNSVEVTTKAAQNVSKEGIIDRLSYPFVTSKHNTFSEKVKSIKVKNNSWGRIASDVIYLTSAIKEHEGFEALELRGNEYTENKALVVAESELKDPYFRQDINPILYAKYPKGGPIALKRDIQIYGHVPKRALPLIGGYLESIYSKTRINWRKTTFPYRYNLTDLYSTDFSDVLHQVLNGITNSNTPYDSNISSILNSEFKMMRYGEYTIRLQYMLPGGRKGSHAIFTYKNPLKHRL